MLAQIIACFYVWMFSNSISLALHLNAGIYSLAVRDFVFLILAVEGILRWRRDG
jgi:nicotinamide riboside transporter PnuC